MKTGKTVKRYLHCLLGLLFTAAGIAVTGRAGLGLPPVFSVPNVLVTRLPALSLGTWVIAWGAVLIALQAALSGGLRAAQLVRLLRAVLLGWFVDLSGALAALLPAEGYAARLALCLTGVVISGFGIALARRAVPAPFAGEALVTTLAARTGKKRDEMQMLFALGCICLAALLSMLFYGSAIVGTREGTILTALFTGPAADFFSSRFEDEPPLGKACREQN